jgi:hypothetical protein
MAKSRNPLAYLTVRDKMKKCRMSKYRSHPICKKFNLRRSCVGKSTAKCRNFKSREKSLRMKRRAKSRGGPGRGNWRRSRSRKSRRK